jgi:hypothetical protein
MWPIAEELLDFPEILFGQSPVIRVEHTKIEHSIAFDTPSVIHVALGVAESESARCCENRLASMQPGVTRARY